MKAYCQTVVFMIFDKNLTSVNFDSKSFKIMILNENNTKNNGVFSFR